ncbi:MAG: FAD binding domain-containing protein [Pseudomonadota bacterium]
MAYSLPTELDAALSLLRDSAPQIMAGGTDIYPAMKPGSQPAAYLDITRIQGFSDISQTDAGTRIGAAVTWSDIVKADLPPAFDALKQAAREVGSLQIQNAGTVAGNICNASPAADGVPALLALDAQVEMASAARGTRLLPLSAFIKGVRQTALADDELVTAITVPKLPDGMVSGFEKQGSRRYLVISIAMTAANVLLDSEGRIAEARIAVGSCSAIAQRLTALEGDLIGVEPDRIEIKQEHLTPLTPIDDVRGTAAYRLKAVEHQIHRAIQKAAQARTNQ